MKTQELKFQRRLLTFRTVRRFRPISDRVTILYTTSQLARYATALATSGTVYDLSLLDKVTDSQGQTQKTYETVVKSEMTDVPSHVWEDIHDGMRRVVQTHEQFNGLGVALSGKTGTAEIDYRQPNHGLFIGYAPSDQHSMRLQSVLPMDIPQEMPAPQQMILWNTFLIWQIRILF